MGSLKSGTLAMDGGARRRLRNDMDAATRGGAPSLHFQPRHCLRTGTPTGAEALPRWPHPRRVMGPAGAFLPGAEAGRRDVPLAGWTLRAACAEAATWDRGVVSVNVAPRQLAGGTLLSHIGEALDESGLDPERLEIELAETMLLSVDTDILLTLSAIRDAGVGVALDGFGTSHGSLSMLKRLPLTAVKLDRAMIGELPEDREDAAIARSVIYTGQAMGLLVVADGIESEAQRAFLAACGCDQGQGDLLAAPAPAERMRGCFRDVFTN